MDKKKLILLTYLLVSVTFLSVFIFLSIGPFWHRDISDIPQQDIPLQAHEYIQLYLGPLILPAIYGLFAFVPIMRLHKGHNSGFGFFRGALVIGTISSLLTFFTSGFSRLDCGDNCAAYIPTRFADNVMLILLLPPLVIVPALLAYFFRPTKQI